MGTAFKFWAQKTASRGHSCRCAEFWAASDSLWLLAKIPKEALHRGMYIPSSSNQCLDVLRIVNETHFSELSKLCCIQLLRRHWNEIIINDYKTKKQSSIYKHPSFSVIVYSPLELFGTPRPPPDPSPLSILIKVSRLGFPWVPENISLQVLNLSTHTIYLARMHSCNLKIALEWGTHC